MYAMKPPAYIHGWETEKTHKELWSPIWNASTINKERRIRALCFMLLGLGILKWWSGREHGD
jgi:hypothetical protein